MADEKVLLAVTELGGYRNFAPLYAALGYTVVMENSVRNAIRALKKITPQLIVAEFNFQSDFRDRTSNLESLLSSIQRFPEIKVIVFYESDYAHQLEKLKAQYPLFAALSFPIDEAALRDSIQRAAFDQ
jgi:hypothetical protein